MYDAQINMPVINLFNRFNIDRLIRIHVCSLREQSIYSVVFHVIRITYTDIEFVKLAEFSQEPNYPRLSPLERGR